MLSAIKILFTIRDGKEKLRIFKNKNVGIIRLRPETNNPNKAAIEKKTAYPRPSILL